MIQINKYFGFFLIILCGLACNGLTNNSSRITKSPVENSDYYYYESRDDTLWKRDDLTRDSIVTDDYYLISKKNNGCAQIGADPLPVRDTLTIELIIDGRFISDLNFNQNATIDTPLVNTILKNLNFGYAIKIDTTFFSDDLEDIPTDGEINQDNIIKNLKPDTVKYDWHVYLFDGSEFFNTANAVTLKDGKDKYILGDGQLLITPFLFIHEIGHALSLTHSNEYYGDTCRFYNVMHESNIGCARYLSHRQILIAHTNRYIEPLKEQYFDDTLNYCGCERKKMDNNSERYINSFDRNIDDTPIVGDFPALINNYREELESGKLDSDIEINLKSNYAREWKSLVNDNAVVDSSIYIAKRLESHKHLRKNNLARWLRENQEEQGILLDPKENFFNRDSTFYHTEMINLVNSSCSDIHNDILKLLESFAEISEKLKMWDALSGESVDTSLLQCVEEIVFIEEESRPDSSGVIRIDPSTRSTLKIQEAMKNLILQQLNYKR